MYYFRKDNLRKNACIHWISRIDGISGSGVFPLRVILHSIRLVSHSYAERTSITFSTSAIEHVASARSLTSDEQRQTERRAPRETEEGEKRTKPTMNEDTYTLEILFGLGMPIYRLPSSPLRPPPGYVTPRKNAPTVLLDRPNCWG